MSEQNAQVEYQDIDRQIEEQWLMIFQRAQEDLSTPLSPVEIAQIIRDVQSSAVEDDQKRFNI